MVAPVVERFVVGVGVDEQQPRGLHWHKIDSLAWHAAHALEFACAVVIIGLLAGVAGAATTLLLHGIEHLTYHYSFGTSARAASMEAARSGAPSAR